MGTPNEIKWGKTFDNILETGSTPGYKVNFSKFHHIIEPKNGSEEDLSAEQRREVLEKYEAEQMINEQPWNRPDLSMRNQHHNPDLEMNLKRRNIDRPSIE